MQGNYKNGNKIGKWLYYDQRGALLREEYYKENRPDGTWKTYYPMEPVESFVEYKDRLKNARTIYYEPNGKIIFEAVFKNNKLLKSISGTNPQEKQTNHKKRNDYDLDE